MVSYYCNHYKIEIKTKAERGETNERSDASRSETDTTFSSAHCGVGPPDAYNGAPDDRGNISYAPSEDADTFQNIGV